MIKAWIRSNLIREAVTKKDCFLGYISADLTPPPRWGTKVYSPPCLKNIPLEPVHHHCTVGLQEGSHEVCNHH